MATAEAPPGQEIYTSLEAWIDRVEELGLGRDRQWQSELALRRLEAKGRRHAAIAQWEPDTFAPLAYVYLGADPTLDISSLYIDDDGQVWSEGRLLELRTVVQIPEPVMCSDADETITAALTAPMGATSEPRTRARGTRRQPASKRTRTSRGSPTSDAHSSSDDDPGPRPDVARVAP